MRRRKRRSGTNPVSRQLPVDDRTLSKILLKCDYKVHKLTAYILTAMDDPTVCNYCTERGCGRLGGTAGLENCAPALAAYLKERDGNA